MVWLAVELAVEWCYKKHNNSCVYSFLGKYNVNLYQQFTKTPIFLATASN